MDHSDLVAELPRIEKLTAAERLKIARDRRVNQILRHEQFDREFPLPSRKEKFLTRNNKRNEKKNGVHFVHRYDFFLSDKSSSTFLMFRLFFCIVSFYWKPLLEMISKKVTFFSFQLAFYDFIDVLICFIV